MWKEKFSEEGRGMRSFAVLYADKLVKWKRRFDDDDKRTCF